MTEAVVKLISMLDCSREEKNRNDIGDREE